MKLKNLSCHVSKMLPNPQNVVRWTGVQKVTHEDEEVFLCLIKLDSKHGTYKVLICIRKYLFPCLIHITLLLCMGLFVFWRWCNSSGRYVT